MITLERIRLVNWHNFIDTVIEIGNRCLLAGDNGSGKSTIIDAIQYLMAANLRMAKFNSAAEERKGGGRDLMGYVRWKLGSEATEYRRGDTVAHIMLEWSKNGTGFSCGVCIEAFKDNHYTEHFWTATDTPIQQVLILSEQNEPLAFRQFKNNFDSVNEKIIFFESKRLYIRDLTNRLGVFKRQQEINPYLDSLTRSIGFKPLASINQFVCDYILEENPVDIQVMKQNLDNYKEADRQAKDAVVKIGTLKKICTKAVEWNTNNDNILKQEYLKLKIEFENEKQKKETAAHQLVETENKLNFTLKEIDIVDKKRLGLDEQLQSVNISIASNDAYRQYEEIERRIKRLELELANEQKNTDRYNNLKSQCETLLNRKIFENLEQEDENISNDLKKFQELKFTAGQKKTALSAELREKLTELADIDRGVQHYPKEAQELRKALENSGIEAHFLAEVAEITDPAWVDAIEGWLNKRRFAILVDPSHFQEAIEIYNSLPRSVAGAFIPNIEKMRDTDFHKVTVKNGSLAELVKAETYGQVYINYILGKVMCADISNLKTYDSAVTKECMTYSSHTASRIRPEVYSRHYLGKAALEKRKKFLEAEKSRLEAELNTAEKEEQSATEHEFACNNVIKSLVEMKLLFSSIESTENLKKDLSVAQTELAAVDTQSFKELEQRREEIKAEQALLNEDNKNLLITEGKLGEKISDYRNDLDTFTGLQEEKEETIKIFSTDNPLIIGECEVFAEEQLANFNIEKLISGHESKLKSLRNKTESLKKEYNEFVREYEQNFHYLLGMEPAENAEAQMLLKRLETSELPEYREKIARAYKDAEKEFKDHFISRLNERIEEARESFSEINSILRTLHFGRDQYRFHLEECSDHKGLIEVIRNTAKIPSMDEGGLFSQLVDPRERKAVEDLFDDILNSPLDSEKIRNICDYRTYFNYDIIITETDSFDEKGDLQKLYLSRVLKEKSGGESQTPYYVAIAASFYRFYKARPEHTVRLVIFDEAFNRMDDERIGKILAFYDTLNLQIITSVPPEKIEAIAPHMDRINIISRFGSAVKVRDCHKDTFDLSDIEIGSQNS